MSEIIIRDKCRLNKMGETGDALKQIAKANPSLKIPIVYRFNKSVSQYITSNEHPIGVVSNMHIDDNGNLVGNVTINHVINGSRHYDGEIDNCVVKKEINDGNVSYTVNCLVVFNIDAKRENQRQSKMDSLVKKTYNAPTQVMDVDPQVGEVLLNKIKAANKDLDEVLTGGINVSTIDKSNKKTDILGFTRRKEE